MISYSFTFADSSFTLPESSLTENWLNLLFQRESSFTEGHISFVLCSDDFLLKINKSYLNHDTLTDIITFPLESETNLIEAEIYISVDRLKDNAANNNVLPKNEFLRLLAHGCLHLCGFPDATPNEKSIMRAKEDEYIAKWKED